MVCSVRMCIAKSRFVLSLFLLTTTGVPCALPESFAAQTTAFSDKMDIRVEIAYLHFQIARGQDALGSARGDAAFIEGPPETYVSPGDELDAAADLKFSAFEEYKTAMKQWDAIAKSIGSGKAIINPQTAKANADVAWDSCQRALDEAIAFHRRAQEYFDSINNIERRTAVLGKLARNLQRRLDLKR
jgi:hypothetical protein